MNITFPFKNIYIPRKFTESAAKGTQTSNQRWRKKSLILLYIFFLSCIMTWILFKINLLQMALKLTFFEKIRLLEAKERAEGLFL